jgi:hypothetical protein
VHAWIGDDPQMPEDVAATATKTWVEDDIVVEIEPEFDVNQVGTPHTVTVTVTCSVVGGVSSPTVS